MSLIASSKQESNFTPIEPGVYVAVCDSVIDLGVQYNERFGKSSRKVLIGWEIPELTVEVGGEQLPRQISKQYTLSLNDKAALRKDLIAWRGRDFTPEEEAAFDLKNIVGAACQINIIQVERNGKTYANISGIMALPKGMPKPGLSGYATVFDLDSDDLSKIETFPGWIKDMITRSETYMDRAANQVKQDMAARDAARQGQQTTFTELDGDDGELPF